MGEPPERAVDAQLYPEREAMIPANLARIRARIEAASRAAGRTDLPRLVGVTKMRTIEEIRSLVDAGVTHLGENRWEEWEGKRNALDEGISWHFIGAIQGRSLRKHYRPLFRVDSLDNLSHARLLSDLASREGVTQSVLLEANILRDPGRSGFLPEELEKEVGSLATLEGLDICGLLVMGPVPDPSGRQDKTRKVFEDAREWWIRLKGHWPFLVELSMGMSEDFEEGIRCGATEVRIGRLLFEEGIV